jgi:hypothetical protein
VGVVLAGKGESHASSASVAVPLQVAVKAGAEALVVALYGGFASASSIAYSDTKGNTADYANEEFQTASSNVPFFLDIRPGTDLTTSDTFTLTARSAANGTGSDVLETRLACVAAKVTNPLPTGVLKDRTSGTAGTSISPAPPATLAPTAVPNVQFLAVRVALVSTDSADLDKVALIPTGWLEVGGAGQGRITSWAPSSGVQTILVYRENTSAVALSTSDAFTLDDATHAWRIMTFALKTAIVAKPRSSGVQTFRPTVTRAAASVITISAKFRGSGIQTFRPTVARPGGALGSKPTTHDKRYLVRGPADLSGLYFDNEVWFTGSGFTGDRVGFAKPPHFVDTPSAVLSNVWCDWAGGGKAAAYIAGATGASPNVNVADTATTATVRSQVEPNGRATTVSIQYGASPSLGSTSPSIVTLGSGVREVVNQLSGLSPNTVYWCRTLMTSSTGTSATPMRMFRTPPASGTFRRSAAIPAATVRALSLTKPCRRRSASRCKATKCLCMLALTRARRSLYGPRGSSG